uniref:Uncharacterized protein n=1 Tax=Magallana gigas TaxID=29159 RepID=A0A8W8NIX9_MAGGI
MLSTSKLLDDPHSPVSWIEGYSAEDIATMQREDADIGIVRTWLEKDENPTKLMLGREVIQPVHLITKNIPGHLSPQTADEWIADLSLRLAEAHACARQNLKQTQHRQKRDYDLRVVEHHYSEGDLVYKLDSTTKFGQSQKLSTG